MKALSIITRKIYSTLMEGLASCRISCKTHLRVYPAACRDKKSIQYVLEQVLQSDQKVPVHYFSSYSFTFVTSIFMRIIALIDFVETCSQCGTPAGISSHQPCTYLHKSSALRLKNPKMSIFVPTAIK